MIISASRRTDIPAFYGEWFINRLRAGWCSVPNPVRPDQVSRVSLAPQDVDVIAFWTRNAAPFAPALDELDRRGYRYFFLYTLMDNPRVLDPGLAPLAGRLAAFEALALRLGAHRVIWRYDPIVLTSRTPPAFHVDVFGRLAQALRGRTSRCTVSVVDLCRASLRRMAALAGQGVAPVTPDRPALAGMFRQMLGIARECGMSVTSCAEGTELAALGVPPGKCIDDAYIRETFGIAVSRRKDPAQRPLCGCVVSRDIGMYETCPAGCVYCYATKDPETAKRNHAAHDPQADRIR